jgi:hypothetical protein
VLVFGRLTGRLPNHSSRRRGSVTLAGTTSRIIVPTGSCRRGMRSSALSSTSSLRKADCDKRIHKLERALEHDRAEAREQAYQTQRLYTATFADLLEGLRADLEAVLPEHDAALARIRQLLTRPPAAVP